MHSPLLAFKSIFRFGSQMSLYHSQKPKPHLLLCSEAPGYLKRMCEVVNFVQNFRNLLEKILFYTIKSTKYQKILGRICQS